jgi:hypothetical protein
MGLNRREMLAGALTGAAVAGLPATAAAQDRSDEIVSALHGIQELLRRGAGPQYPIELQQIRQSMHAHLRATGSFPRFVEVGNEVWDHAYDWHVVNDRPIEVTRVGDRYQMPFLHTTLVLRPDATPTYVATPSDLRQP